MKFLVDTQLPPALCIAISGEGHDCRHTLDYHNGNFLPDSEILDFAISEDRVIITKDQDFMDYFFLRGSPPKLWMIRLGNCSNDVLFKRVLGNIESVTIAFESGIGAIEMFLDEVIVHQG